MKRLNYVRLALAGLSLATLSCTKDFEERPDHALQGVPAEIEVTIEGMNHSGSVQTRYNPDMKTDHWTSLSFSSGDRIGLFATTGLIVDGQVQPILNEYMDFYQATGSSNYRFRNDDLMINTGLLTGRVGRYVYFPYCPDMPFPDLNETIPANSNKNFYAYPTKEKPGMKLRVKGADGIERCVDFMYISSINTTNGALSGGFYHGFCEMIILRGTGFDKIDERFPVETDPEKLKTMDAEQLAVNEANKKKQEIWLVLDKGITHLTLCAYFAVESGNYTWIPQTWPENNTYNWDSKFYDIKDNEGKVTSSVYCRDAYKDMYEADGMTLENAKRWQAWEAEKYMDMKEDGTPDPRRAWYAILPSAHSRYYPVLDHIEICNNEGELCKVTNYELYTNPTTGVSDKQMRSGYRFAVEVMMTEHGATARPVSIADWSDDDGEGVVKGEDGTEVNNKNDITDIRTVGINQNSVNEWVTKYNAYINAGSPHPADLTEASLTNLSDAEKTALAALKPYGDYIDRVWHFYITEDLTLPDYTLEKLVDVLEGASPVANYTISNLRSTPFNSISSRGALKNLDFDRLYVNVSASPDGEPNPVGALTNRLDGGTIENCHINNGTIIGPQGTPIGMLCGTVNGGTVKNCSVSGAVIGTIDSSSADDTRYKGLFGKVESAPTLESNDKSGLIVQSK